MFALNGQRFEKPLLRFGGFPHHIGQDRGILVMGVSITRVALGRFFETFGRVLHLFREIGLQHGTQAIIHIREFVVDVDQPLVVFAGCIEIALELGQFTKQEKGSFVIGINFGSQGQLLQCPVEVAGILCQNQAIEVMQLCTARINFDRLFHVIDARFHLTRCDQTPSFANEVTYLVTAFFLFVIVVILILLILFSLFSICYFNA